MSVISVNLAEFCARSFCGMIVRRRTALLIILALRNSAAVILFTVTSLAVFLPGLFSLLIQTPSPKTYVI